MPGVTSSGLEIATIADLLEEMGIDWRDEFGQSMDVSDASPDGQFLGVFAEPQAKLWELLEVLAFAHDPNRVGGALLRAICAITGTTPTPASFSTVTLTATGTPTTVIPLGKLFSAASTDQQFTVDEAGGAPTIAAATAWAGSTAYALDVRRTNAGNVYQVITPGTSAASGGPTGTGQDITDDTVHWRWLGEGTGVIDFLARATVVGPIVAVAGDLTQIDTPVGGLENVINLLDATLGRATMTDPQLRAKRELELAKPGTTPPDAIEAAALEVGEGTDNPVTSATAFHNPTDVTEDGVPPHSVELVVSGGEDQDIWDMLRVNVSSGIRTHGTEVGTSIDRAGRAQTMKFSRVTELLIYVSVTLVKDPNSYPSDGDAQVKAAIATKGNLQPDGTDVESSAVLARVFSVPGVIRADLPLIDDAPAPATTTAVAVSLRQRAVFDTTRITVTSSDGVP